MKTCRGAWLAKHRGAERRKLYDFPAGPLEWLVDLLHDAGICRIEYGTGTAINIPLDWRDIAAWVEGAGMHDIEPEFRRDMLRLSAEFAAEANAATNMERQAPFQPE